MAMRAVVGAAVFEHGMRIDDVEQVAQDLIGFIVELRLAGGRAADHNGSLERGEERQLALGPGAADSPEIREIGVLIEDLQVSFKGLGTVGLGQGGKAGHPHGFVLIDMMCTKGQNCSERAIVLEESCAQIVEARGS